MNKTHLTEWLREESPAKLDDLFARADGVRRESVGEEVHLRGLVEISNECRRNCLYCGLRAANRSLKRYRLDADEVIECARKAYEYGYGTVVLQAGETADVGGEWIAAIVRRIKDEFGLAVTLSLGERDIAEYELWRNAGADRYLLRFETSSRALYERIHPPLPGRRSDRLAILRALRALGYEIGGGVMIGIPGQTWDMLADDLLMFHDMDLDMIGMGPYLPHPETPLGSNPFEFAASTDVQVPNSEETTYKMIALARILCPEANIPSTTALATLNTAEGRERGLQSGANVVMPNLTPIRYRELYEIYPGKACVSETAEACSACLRRRIAAIGRTVGTGPGGRRHRSHSLSAQGG